MMLIWGGGGSTITFVYGEIFLLSNFFFSQEIFLGSQKYFWDPKNIFGTPKIFLGGIDRYSHEMFVRLVSTNIHEICSKTTNKI